MHSLAGSRRDGQAQKTAILNYTHTHRDGGRRRRYRRLPKCVFLSAALDAGGSACTYQAGRAPACPVVPILNTCQQKLSSPTCFKHQTCNYLFTPNTFAAPAFVYFLRRLSGQWEEIWRCIRKAMSLGPRRCFASCERGLSKKAAARRCSGARPVSGSMSNGCKAQQRPDTAAGDGGHS